MADRAWRLVATGLCFVSFGLGSLVIGLVALPLLKACSRDPVTCVRRGQALIHHGLRGFVRAMCCLGVISVHVEGRQHLGAGPRLVLANHPSLIDVVLLLSLLKRASCIVKAALRRNAFTRGPIAAAGYLGNAGGGAVVEECIAALRRGENLIVFPEGTRTAPAGAIRLRRGAANIAVRAGCPIVPVIIRVSTPLLTKGSRWYRVPATRPHFDIAVKPAVDVRPYIARNRSAPLAARELTAWMQDFMMQEAGHLGRA
jgi:1-acyl-sn-glycerol-3-phosphate acyltransferase